MIRSDNAIRCLEHNSPLSLFCQNENKLLCSNCVFGSTAHKFHKVVPIDRSKVTLNQQIAKMESSVQKETFALTDIEQIIAKNRDLE